jgi:hypothetical protein
MKSQKDKLEIALRHIEEIDGIISDAIDAEDEAEKLQLMKSVFSFEGVEFSFLDLIILDVAKKGKTINDESIKYFYQMGVKSDLLSEGQMQMVSELERPMDRNIESQFDQLSLGSSSGEDQDQDYVYYSELQNIVKTKTEKEVLLTLKKWRDCGHNAVHLAAIFGDVGIIKYLKKIKFSFIGVDKDGYNALHLACNNPDVELTTVQALCEFQTRNSNSLVKCSQDNAVHISCGSGVSTEVIKYLLDQSVVINQLNTDDESPFVVAVNFVVQKLNGHLEFKDLDVLKLFLSRASFEPEKKDLEMVENLSKLLVEDQRLSDEVGKIMKEIKQKQKPSQEPKHNGINQFQAPSLQITPPQ